MVCLGRFKKMKNRSWLIFLVFSLFFFISCGGNENAQEETGDTDGENIAVSIRAAGDGSCTGLQIDCLSQQLAAVSFQIRDGQGETVFQKSVERKELADKNVKLTGIKNVDNATLIVSAFGMNEAGVADLNTPKWEGKVSGLKFEKGKTTSVTIILYPKNAQNQELSMPEELTVARFGHTSTVLADGRLLVAGGFTMCSSLGKCPATETVEIIDFESGKIELLSNMVEKRALHTAIALNDGSVLFIGGTQTFDVNLQESAFEGFPFMRYTPTSAALKIERYMPSYPKYNMKENGFGSPVANFSEPLATPSTIPFSAFQSVLAERTSDTEIAVFLVGGLDENGVPSKKSYKFTITETDEGTVSVGEVTELAESSEPMLLPALAYSNGSLLAVGGRPAASEYAASVITESASEDFGSSADNIFFTRSIFADEKLYTFGGYEIDSKTKSFINTKYRLDENGEEMLDDNGNPIAETRLNRNRTWDISGKSVTTAKDLLRSTDANVLFPATAYDQKNNRFLVIGGTNAANIYQAINADSLVPYDKPTTHIMSDKRIMPSAAILPAGVISDNPAIVITGGINALDSTGSAVNTIKINNL